SDSAWRGQRRTAASTFARSDSGGRSTRRRARSSSPTTNTSGASFMHSALPSQRSWFTTTRMYGSLAAAERRGQHVRADIRLRVDRVAFAVLHVHQRNSAAKAPAPLPLEVLPETAARAHPAMAPVRGALAGRLLLRLARRTTGRNHAVPARRLV